LYRKSGVNGSGANVLAVSPLRTSNGARQPSPPPKLTLGASDAAELNPTPPQIAPAAAAALNAFTLFAIPSRMKLISLMQTMLADRSADMMDSKNC
jgi:hypothetical protein